MSIINVEKIPAATVSMCFIRGYYTILIEHPEKAYKFYQENSQLGRQDHNGNMRITTTLEAINEKILSMHCNILKVHVLSLEAEDSIGNGVKVTLTGFMLGMGNSGRNFVQVFFLSPTEAGYFVLNDTLCFLDQDSSPVPKNEEIVATIEINEDKNVDNVETMVNEEEIPLVEGVDAEAVPLDEVVDEVPNIETMVDAEQVPLDDIRTVETVVEAEAVPLVDEVPNVETMVDAGEVPQVPNVETVVNAEMASHHEVVVEAPNVETILVDAEVPLDAAPVELAEEVPNVETEVNAEMASHLDVVVEAPIVEADAKVTLGNVVDEVRDDSRSVEPHMVPLAEIVDEVPNESYASTEIGATSSSHALPSPGISLLQPSISAAEEIPIYVEADQDYSIYIKCLPMSVTSSLLEDEFKRFGAIMNGGIQVKINKQGFCFGLVKFEEANSVQKALKASPVGIGGRQIVVEEKHSSKPRVGRGAHRFRHYRITTAGRGSMQCGFPIGNWAKLLR